MTKIEKSAEEAIVDERDVWYISSIARVLSSYHNWGGVVCHGWLGPTKDETALSDPAGALRGGPNELVAFADHDPAGALREGHNGQQGIAQRKETKHTTGGCAFLCAFWQGKGTSINATNPTTKLSNAISGWLLAPYSSATLRSVWE